jgi:hypothetical protein
MGMGAYFVFVRPPVLPLVAALTGLTSIGWMVVVNFLIDSDFKWLLLAFSLPWVMAVALHRLKAEQQPDDLVRGSGDV